MSESQELCAAVVPLVQEMRARIRLVARDASLAEIARMTGFKGETVRRYLTSTTPSLPFIMRVCERWELNANWLLFGVGPRYALDLDAGVPGQPESDSIIVASIAKLIEQAGRGSRRGADPMAFSRAGAKVSAAGGSPRRSASAVGSR